MNKKIYLLLSVLMALSFNLKAQTAQIESVTATPGDNVTFDITVAGFPSNVGAISLFIGYDANVLTFTGTTSGTITGYVANNMAASQQVGIQWTNPTGQAIDGVLLTLNFHYSAIGGMCDLTFNPGCEFADILLNTISVSYAPGSIGPLGSVATLTIPDMAASAGVVNVPVTAAGFPSNVGAITLFIAYDNTKLTYTGTTAGTITGYYANASNGVIGISYTNIGGTAIDGTLLTLNFNYSNGTSPLTFLDGCEIVENDFDLITTSYNSGSVYPIALGQTITLDDVTAIPGNMVDIPITAAGFDATYDVAAITLNIGFDQSCLTFVNITGGTISGAYANVVSPGLLGITWTDFAGDDIDGTLLTLHFMYNIGECALTFEGGCEIANIDLSVIPTSFYDGSVSQGNTPATASLPQKGGVVGQPISFPITVANFPNNVGAISLFINFDPGVLQYTGTTPGTLSGYYANYIPAWSSVGIQWSDPAGMDISPNSPDTLLTLEFIYMGGVCDVNFGAGCEFAENDLTPIPVAYYNGAVIQGIKVSIKAFLEGPFNGTTMNTGLNSAGLLPLVSPYGGGESVAAIPNANVVDWVEVTLRDADVVGNATAATEIGSKAGFILNDGTVVSLDGESEILFNVTVTENLFVIVNHRNHIRVLSANSLPSSFVDGYEVYSYDFTTALAQAYNSQQTIPPTFSTACLYVADIDNDGNIFTSDLNLFVSVYPSFAVYSNSDLDMDGNVFTSDINKFVINYPKFTSIP